MDINVAKDTEMHTIYENIDFSMEHRHHLYKHHYEPRREGMFPRLQVNLNTKETK